MTYTAEFFDKMFVGLTIDPSIEDFDNLVYLYWEDESQDGGAIEEEKVEFVQVVGDVLQVRTFETNESNGKNYEYSTEEFIPLVNIQSIRMVDPSNDIQEHWKQNN